MGSAGAALLRNGDKGCERVGERACRAEWRHAVECIRSCAYDNHLRA